LIGVIYGSGTEGTYYKYDAEGKIIISCKRAGTSNYQTGYKYNLAGGVTDEVRSDRRKNTYYYDQAGRLTGYQTSNYPYLAFTNVVSNIQYTAFGAIQQETYGNSLLHSLDYNARSQPMRIWLGQLGNPGAVMRMDYIFGLAEEVNVDDQSILQQYNNGNVGRINYYINGALQRSQTFQYDGLNRLKYAVEHTNGDHSDAARAWYQTLQYDRFGNRGIDVANSSGNASGSGGALQLSEFDAANNRITRSGYTYDAAGNLTAEPGKSYAYDAENRMITAAAQGVTTIQCMYDGNGRRVKKIVNGFGTGFEYGAGGELLTERDDSGNIIKDYLYRNGELIATAETGGTVYKYATSDHLGSPRVWTDSNGNVVAGGRHDYLPFGDELFAGNGTRAAEQGYASHTQQDGQRKQFGSKERDIETGLDYFLARYYSSAQGRFTSPDEFAGGPVELFTFADAASANPTFYADLTNPQSLNKYQYTYNNPLSYTDSDGHCPECPAYWLNSKIQEIDRKITQIKTDLVDYGKGLGKSVANAAIDTVNFGNVSMLDDGRLHYNYKRYEPSNEVQAMGMNSGDKLMLLSIGLGKPLPVNVAMAEAEGAVVSTELINKADIIREAGLHPASRNQRTIAVGEDAAGGLHAGSSNGFDRGQRAAAEKLGVRCVRCKGDNHAEENLLREVPDLRKVGTSKRSPCGPGEHNCRGQLEQRGVKIENDR
jgi:RHS repeat-associated protein